MADAHTPGPWTAQRPRGVMPAGGGEWPRSLIFAEGVGQRVADAYWPCDEQEANARLIAAAPDLLAACEAILGPMDYYDPVKGFPLYEPFQMLKAAIAKAKGA